MKPDSDEIKSLISQGDGYNPDWFTIIFKRPELERESFEGGGKTTQKILGLIKENPNITRKELAAISVISEDGIKYHITNLKSMGVLEMIGPDKGGYWRIVGDDA